MLEIVITVVIVVALLLFIGVSAETIFVIGAVVILGLIAIAMALFALFFLITDISLLFRKRVTGIFLRIDETDRFANAVYSVDKQEYTCIFPAESFGRKNIYHENKQELLLISRNSEKRSAYDRHSLVIIVIGNLFSIIFAILLAAALLFLRTGL